MSNCGVNNIQHEKFEGLIFKTINRINGIIYIGQTANVEIWKKEKYKGSGKIIKEAFKKYGFNNFSSELICYASSQTELDDLETFYIKEFNSLVPNGYNISLGGKGVGQHSKETREKISIANKGKIRSKDAKLKISIANKGRKTSEETKEKLRQASLGKKHSEETKLKLSKSMYNRLSLCQAIH